MEGLGTLLVCFPLTHPRIVSLQKFIETDPSPRKDATVIQVKEGQEPASFKALFPAWDDALFEVQTSVRTPQHVGVVPPSVYSL